MAFIYVMKNSVANIASVVLGILLLSGVQSRSSAQELYGYESFDAAEGTQLDSLPGWQLGRTGDAPLISNGSLDVTGLQTPLGNKASLTSNRNAEYSFTPTPGELNTFVGFAFSITDLMLLDSTGEQFFAIALSGMNQVASLWIRRNGATGFDIGLNREFYLPSVDWSDNGGSGYSTATTYFTLVEFEQGGSYSLARFWLSPTQGSFAFGTNDSSPPLLEMGSSVNKFGPNQLIFGPASPDSGLTTPVAFSIDEIRVATDKATASIPEPSTWLLLALGTFAILLRFRKLRKH
jgi:hypothetical protein